MSTATVAAQTSVASGLLIAQPVVLLDDHPAHGLPCEHERVTIYADIVQVRGRYFLPGRTVEIYARKIEADRGVIDVSGAAVTKDYDITQADPSLNGTKEVPDGKSGASGEHGHNGGTIKVIVGEITGDLSLVANGSRGGNSQRGGDGHAGQDGKTGADGEFLAHMPPKGKFGARVVEQWASGGYMEMAYGEKGGDDALPGGNAGPPGQPGNGGAGGKIELSYVACSTSPKLEANGGAAGLMGEPGKVGRAGQPGLGGRNRLYQGRISTPYEPYQPGDEIFADDPYYRIRLILQTFGLAPRAASGAPSRDGTIPPNPPPGVDGAAGTTKTVPGLVDLGYLELIRQSAAEDVARGNVPRALERYRWLRMRTTYLQPAENRYLAHVLHMEATERIKVLEKR